MIFICYVYLWKKLGRIAQSYLVTIPELDPAVIGSPKGGLIYPSTLRNKFLNFAIYNIPYIYQGSIYARKLRYF